MRGEDQRQPAMWSYVRLEERVPPDHPLRAIRQMTERALAELDPRFDAIYPEVGRPSIPPSSCCGRWCCRSCTPSAASAC